MNFILRTIILGCVPIFVFPFLLILSANVHSQELNDSCDSYVIDDAFHEGQYYWNSCHPNDDYPIYHFQYNKPLLLHYRFVKFVDDLNSLKNVWLPSPYSLNSYNLLFDHSRDAIFSENSQKYFPYTAYTYLSNPAVNVLGGIKPGGTYADSHLFALGFDSKHDFGFLGDIGIDASFLVRSGQNLSAEYVGNQFTVQQVYGGQTFIFYGLTFDFKIDLLSSSFRIGRMSTSDVFSNNELYCLYMNNAICGVPQSLAVSNAGFSTFPGAVWGISSDTKISKNLSLNLGVYQVADINVAESYGFDWTISPDDGVSVYAQFNHSLNEEINLENRLSSVENCIYDSILSDRSDYIVCSSENIKSYNRGNFSLGAFSSFRRIVGFDDNQTGNNVNGLYVQSDYQITREYVDPSQGLRAWFNTTLIPRSEFAYLPLQVNLGLVYTGLIPSRDLDVTFAGLFLGSFSDNYLNTLYATPKYALTPQFNPNGYELVFEIGHKIMMTKTLFFQPDLQLIFNPKGLNTLPTSVVLGAQIGFAL